MLIDMAKKKKQDEPVEQPQYVRRTVPVKDAVTVTGRARRRGRYKCCG